MWSEWTNVGSCSTTCDLGVQNRARACDDPSPSPEGANCLLEDGTFGVVENGQEVCNLGQCPIAGNDCSYLI